jgi:iron(III) transport system ATP-binding protein
MIEIALDGMTKVFGTGRSAVAAVENVSLHVRAGELFFLLGPSGCGKTTLLRMIAGLVDPTRGRVLFDGRDVTHLPVERRNTAMVFQNYALWPHMTVGQNVEFGPKMRRVAADERRRLVRGSLQRVQMAELTGRKPNELSGGQQQRVAVARALAARPECLLLDEPLSNLDARLRLHMRGELRGLVKSTGTTAVYVTHDQKEALSMADRVAVMDAGRVVQVGEPEALYERPANRFVADFLGEANLIDGEAAAEGEGVRIETACGTLLARGAGGGGQRRRVTCCVRPENVRVLGEGEGAAAPAAGALRARVEASTFLGEIRQYRLRLAEDVVWKATALTGVAPRLEAGAAVSLSIPPEAVALLPPEPEAEPAASASGG